MDNRHNECHPTIDKFKTAVREYLIPLFNNNEKSVDKYLENEETKEVLNNCYKETANKFENAKITRKKSLASGVYLTAYYLYILYKGYDEDIFLTINDYFVFVNGGISTTEYNNVIRRILKELDAFEGIPLSIELLVRRDYMKYIQSTQIGENYRVEIAIFSADGKYHIYAKENIPFNEADSIFKSVCVDEKTPDFTNWNDVTRKILSDAAISKIEADDFYKRR